MATSHPNTDLNKSHVVAMSLTLPHVLFEESCMDELFALSCRQLMEVFRIFSRISRLYAHVVCTTFSHASNWSGRLGRHPIFSLTMTSHQKPNPKISSFPLHQIASRSPYSLGGSYNVMEQVGANARELVSHIPNPRINLCAIITHYDHHHSEKCHGDRALYLYLRSLPDHSRS